MKGDNRHAEKKTFFTLLSFYLAFTMALITLPAQGWAMFIPNGQAGVARQADMTSIQKTLESTVIKQRLMDYGLSSEEALAKINKLSDEQVHQFASRLDSLQAGADDGIDALVLVLFVAIIVVLVLEVTGHRVIVR
ncbi:MAG: PA2779 family protein [Betaproteobacteria bacterium]